MARLPEEVVKARIKGEQTRALENIAARTERPEQMWWLSFADENGFRGAVIVHAEDFITAVMECNIRSINPHGECRGMPVPLTKTIPEKWKYRILSREECSEFDKEMTAAKPS